MFIVYINCVDGCTEGDTRLVKDGVSGNEGRLEVCQHGIWGTVCEDIFSRVDARVVCRNLGYSEQCESVVVYEVLHGLK